MVENIMFWYIKMKITFDKYILDLTQCKGVLYICTRYIIYTNTDIILL